MLLMFFPYSFRFVISAPPSFVSPDCSTDSTRSWEVVALVPLSRLSISILTVLRDTLLGHRLPDPLRQGCALAERS